MPLLPNFQSDDRPFQLMQSKWAAVLNPLLKLPILQGNLLQGISLSIGTNEINHQLGRPLVGWQLSRLRAAASIYDVQDSNPIPSVTLRLVSDAEAVIDLWVY